MDDIVHSFDSPSVSLSPIEQVFSRETRRLKEALIGNNKNKLARLVFAAHRKVAQLRLQLPVPGRGKRRCDDQIDNDQRSSRCMHKQRQGLVDEKGNGPKQVRLASTTRGSNNESNTHCSRKRNG